MSEQEPLIRLRDVPKLSWLPGRGGKRLHHSTVFRWVQRGVRGRKLQVVCIGGALATTENWLREFFERLAENHEQGGDAGGAKSIGHRTPSQRARAVRRANAFLEKAGI